MSKGKDFVVNILGDQAGADKAFEMFEKNAGKAAVGAAAAFAAVKIGEAMTSNLDAAALEDKVAASLGASAVEAERWGNAAAGAYRNAWGGSMEEASAAVESVVGNISSLRGAADTDIQAATEKALALAQAMEVDVAESTKAAGILISNGLAPDANAAFDLITAGLQQVPTAMRGEALDALSEYSVNFANLGISGDEAMGMLAGSAGISSVALDKTGDAIKEFTLLSQDTARTGPVFEQLGLDAQQMATAIAGGGEGAKAAFGQIVTGLQGIADPSAKAQTAIALFGSPVEDLGINEIPAFVDALASASTGLGDTGGAADAMAATLSSNPKASVESMRRSFEGWQQDLVGLPGPLGTVAAGVQAFGGDALALGSSVAMGAFALSQMNVAAGAARVAQVAGSVATGVATAAQWAWNAALSANPIGIVIVAIGALVAGLGWFFTQTEAGKAVVDAVWGGIQSAIGGVTGWWTDTALPTMKAGWVVLETMFQVGKDKVAGFMKGVGDAIYKVFSWTPLGLIVTNWDAIWGFFQGIPAGIGKALSGVGSAITSAFKAPFNSVAGFWNRSIGGLSFEIPDWVPGLGGKGFSFPKIPMLATGGVVTAATLAMVGEGREPEAVLPLSKLDAMLANANPRDRGAGDGGSGNVYIDTYNAGRASSEEVARDLAWQMGR